MKKLIIVFIIIVIIFSIGAFFYRGYKLDREAPIRAKFVQNKYFYTYWGGTY